MFRVMMMTMMMMDDVDDVDDDDDNDYIELLLILGAQKLLESSAAPLPWNGSKMFIPQSRPSPRSPPPLVRTSSYHSLGENHSPE